jgi:hypothetical protein
MRTRRKATITELRLAIDSLPLQTRVAMLEGIRSNQIIVGAYTSSDGICPMLAAHRAGGRTSFIAFAKAWDRFAFRGARKCTARRASERELLVLSAHLEASLLDHDGPGPELAEAIREHRALTSQPPHPTADTVPGATAETAPDATAETAPGATAESGPEQGPERASLRTGTGDADRSRELAKRPGWSWMRIMRRYDEYERALSRLRAAEASAPAHEHDRVTA